MLRLEHNARKPMKMGGNLTKPEPQCGMRPLRKGSVGRDCGGDSLKRQDIGWGPFPSISIYTDSY